jgi:uncharacterized protein YbgA (DUF1722 family)
MGVPRENVRLVGSVEQPRLVAERSGRDWTVAMQTYAARRVQELLKLDLCGYILKKDSPTCGLERVRVYPGPGKTPHRNGRGMFAQVLMSASALLPIEEEGRLNDPKLRDNFIERVFAYARWRMMVTGRPSLKALISFHTRHKFTILSHSDLHLQRLGRLVAQAKGSPLAGLLEEYGRTFMEALAILATIRKHVNVLQHLAGFVSDRLTPEQRAELEEVIRDYHRALVPLVVPVTLLKHFVRTYRVVYLEEQVYLQPHPKELMLRNHV